MFVGWGEERERDEKDGSENLNHFYKLKKKHGNSREVTKFFPLHKSTTTI